MFVVDIVVSGLSEFVFGSRVVVFVIRVVVRVAFSVAPFGLFACQAVVVVEWFFVARVVVVV